MELQGGHTFFLEYYISKGWFPHPWEKASGRWNGCESVLKFYIPERQIKNLQVFQSEGCKKSEIREIVQEETCLKFSQVGENIKALWVQVN